MDLTQVSSSRSNPNSASAAGSGLFDERPFIKRLDAFDWLFAFAMVAGADGSGGKDPAGQPIGGF